MLKQMGLVNNLRRTAGPWLASVFGIFLVRQYALSIPDELLEAARHRRCRRVPHLHVDRVPAAQPIVVTLAVLTSSARGNDFMWPLIVLTDRDCDAAGALAGLSREHVQDTELMMAAHVVTVLAVRSCSSLLQRYYMQGC